MKQRGLSHRIASVVGAALVSGWMCISAHASVERFVDQTVAQDVEGCGAKAQPCATIGAALRASAPGDSVQIAAGRYSEQIVIDRHIELHGAGRDKTIVDASAKPGRPLTIEKGVKALVRGLTLTGGRVTGRTGGVGQPGTEAVGGGVHNQGELILLDAEVRGNQVHGGAGGNGVSQTAAGATGRTGGAGRNARFERGSSAGGTGGTGGQGPAGGVGGNGGIARGGGLFNAGRLTLVNVIVADNLVAGGAGGTGGRGGRGGTGGRGGKGGGGHIDSCIIKNKPSPGGTGGRGGRGGTAGAGGQGGHALGGGLFNRGELSEFVGVLVQGNQVKAGIGGKPGNPGAGGSRGRGGTGGAGVKELKVLGARCKFNAASNGARGRVGPRGSNGPAGKSGVPSGGGFANENGRLDLTNITVAGNRAENAAALVAYRSSEVRIRNAILAANVGNRQITISGKAKLVAIRSCVADWSSKQATSAGEDNIANCDPKFADVDGMDDQLGNADDDLRLTAASPVVDIGLAEVPSDAYDLDGDGDVNEPLPLDLSGNQREMDAPFNPAKGIDLGAFEYSVNKYWVAGQPVPPPAGIVLQPGRPLRAPVDFLRPDGSSDPAAFFWSEPEQQLYAVKSGDYAIVWSMADEPATTVQQVGATRWPSDPQVAIVGAPVDLTPSREHIQFAQLVYATPKSAEVDGTTWRATAEGFAVLQFSQEKGDRSFPLFKVVRMLEPADGSEQIVDDRCKVGEPLRWSAHVDPTGATGYVLNTASAYDGVGATSPYKRAERVGNIVPVSPTLEGVHEPLKVAWYRADDLGVAWPELVVEHRCQWPSNTPVITIAGDNGGGVLDRSAHPQASIYHQPVRSEAGFKPNAEHAFIVDTDQGLVVYALRSDLRADPYVLMKYRGELDWAYKVFGVQAESDDEHLHRFTATAGERLRAPPALAAAGPLDCTESNGVSGPFHRDYRGGLWARAEGSIKTAWFYRLQSSFWLDLDDDGSPDAEPGTCVPWLAQYAGTPDSPAPVGYAASWPDKVAELRVGESLLQAKRNLPSIRDRLAVAVVHDQAGVQLRDPVEEHRVPLAALPGELRARPVLEGEAIEQLPPHLEQRLFYDPRAKELVLRGVIDDSLAGEPFVLPNMLSRMDALRLQRMSSDKAWHEAIAKLLQASTVARDESEALTSPNKILSAGGVDRTGYVTLAFDDDKSTAGTPSLAVIKVACPLYPGRIHAVASSDAFAEPLALVHDLDFAGVPENAQFLWQFQPEASARSDWRTLRAENGESQGANSIVLQAGSDASPIVDNLVKLEYRAFKGICDSDRATTEPQLAEGWVKRAVAALSPFEQQVDRFRESGPDTYASLLSLAGDRYAGDVALRAGGERPGLIAAYQTVLNRAKSLSINAEPPLLDDQPSNQALLLAAGRVAQMYLLLGNEAYADAADPTVPFPDVSTLQENRATAAFAFLGRRGTLLGEELDLLRGRDAARKQAPFNRLLPNFGTDGEPFYQRVYGIVDSDDRAGIAASDALLQYPQGHGDAWGHYLTALDSYYQLLRHPRFKWVPRSEKILVAGQTVEVDYLDERRFARAAVARARVGNEVIALTHRRDFQDDPAERLRGRADLDRERAFGAADWGTRAGQGAYFDWVVGNAILPQRHCDPERDDHGALKCTSEVEGISRIERSTVPELQELSSLAQEIQSQVDGIDKGLNPLGLARDAIPFDIDPDRIFYSKESHFEQIYERALKALNNAVAAFEHASAGNKAGRAQEEGLVELRRQIRAQEQDYLNRLVEIFGYPYSDDIGPGGSYASGYEGPDIYHYDYVDASQLMPLEQQSQREHEIEFIEDWAATVTWATPTDGDSSQPLQPADINVKKTSRSVKYRISNDGFGLVKPPEWKGKRRAPGELQLSRLEMLQRFGQFRQSVAEYEGLSKDIEAQWELLAIQIEKLKSERKIRQDGLNQITSLNNRIRGFRGVQQVLRRISEYKQLGVEAAVEAVPVGADPGAPARAAIRTAGRLVTQKLGAAADVAEFAQFSTELERELISSRTEFQLLSGMGGQLEVRQALNDIQQRLRQEKVLRLSLFTMRQGFSEAQGRYLAALARGERLLTERQRFRKETVAQIQDHRYKDLTFRVFRDEGLEKYRAQFDLAARYVYLAAKAFDYETAGIAGSSQDLLAQVVASRSIGEVTPAMEPQAGHGLAGVLARLAANFSVLKPRLGVNNAQVEGAGLGDGISLRWERFRFPVDGGGLENWRKTLKHYRVDDLWTIPEFRRYALPFQRESEGPQPGLVIDFWTTIDAGTNLFGWPSEQGDHSRSSTNFATRLRGVAVEFHGYDKSGLAATPRAYLIPAGMDIGRIPGDSKLRLRKWDIYDQRLPLPFPLGQRELDKAGFIPGIDGLMNEFGAERRFSEFRAYAGDPRYAPEDNQFDRRLIGRSVWNTRWILIVPGISLLGDANAGLDRFIEHVDDIVLYLQTYAYSGG